MKRKTDNTTSRVYAYGVEPPDDPHVHAEIGRQRALWDRLVDIDRETDHALDASIQADWPEYRQQVERLKAQSALVRDLIDQRRQERAKARRKLETPDLDKRIDEAIQAKREIRAQLWAMTRAWKAENKETVREHERARRAAATQARKESGLYWGNYQRVLDDFDAARRTCRKKGRRPRYSDPSRDDGVLHIGHPAFNRDRPAATGMTPDDLMAGRCGALRIVPVDPAAWSPETPRGERRRLCRTLVTIRVDAAGNTVTLVMHMHRPLPDDARVKCAQLVWRSIGERREGRLCLTLSLPRRDVRSSSNRAAGVDVGWRLEKDRNLRVATVRSSDGALDHVHLDARWMGGMDQVERLHEHIDDDLLRIAQWAQERDDLPEAVIEALSRWRPGLGARHVDAAALHDAVRLLRDSLPEALTTWYSRYRHLLLWRDNLRVKLIRRRREVYRLAARRIAMTHAVIGIEDINLAQMARTKKREDGSDPELHAQARAQRVRACVHDFLAELRHQASKHGAEIVEVSGPSTMWCGQCHEVTTQRDRAMLHWECEHCGAVWDQDTNAAGNLLDAASGAVVREDRHQESMDYGPLKTRRSERSQNARQSHV